jgi:cation:H+ antiporter
MDQNVITLLLALLAILAGSFFILYGSIPARHALPALLVGVLLLSFGTTIPEFAITLQAVFGNLDRGAVDKLSDGSPAAIETFNYLTKVPFPVAVILGSCFANLFLVGGLAGLTLKKPYKIENFTYARDLPFLFLAILLVTGISWWWSQNGNQMPHADADRTKVLIGVGLLAAAVFYIVVVFVTELMSNRDKMPAEKPEERGPDIITALFCALLGAAGLGLGVYVLAHGTPQVIDFFAGPDRRVDFNSFPVRVQDKQLYAQYGLLFIGLAVALPEILVTLFAWLRSDSDAVAGNLIGSTIFNLLGVLGLGIVLSKGRMLDGLDWSIFNADFGVLLIGAGLLAFFLYSDKRLEAWEGFLLMVLYGGYWAVRFMGILPFHA